jgi:hypothetical protein
MAPVDLASGWDSVFSTFVFFSVLETGFFTDFFESSSRGLGRRACSGCASCCTVGAGATGSEF